MAVTTRATPPGELPAFMRLAAHPIRWRLLEELGRSDRAVRELTGLVGESQSLVSYHLRELRDAELVTARRSSADGRDSYYAIDLERCRDLFRSAGAALHPALYRSDIPPHDGKARAAARCRVLFLCTGNSARSQLAEALLAHRCPGGVVAASAGTRPKPVHPNAVRVLRERGIDIRGWQSKHVDQFARRRFDMVITLCDRVREVCRELRGGPDAVHWSVPDPSLEGDDHASYPAFERTADELETRIEFLLVAIDNRPRRRSRS